MKKSSFTAFLLQDAHAENGPRQRSCTADGNHGDDLENIYQIEGLGVDDQNLMAPENRADAGDEAAQSEGEHLVRAVSIPMTPASS